MVYSKQIQITLRKVSENGPDMSSCSVVTPARASRPSRSSPTAGTYNVKYYGKGEHNAGTIYLTSGQTLYIDQGAKVYANVKTIGSSFTINGTKLTGSSSQLSIDKPANVSISFE